MEALTGLRFFVAEVSLLCFICEGNCTRRLSMFSSLSLWRSVWRIHNRVTRVPRESSTSRERSAKRCLRTRTSMLKRAQGIAQQLKAASVLTRLRTYERAVLSFVLSRSLLYLVWNTLMRAEIKQSARVRCARGTPCTSAVWLFTNYTRKKKRVCNLYINTTLSRYRHIVQTIHLSHSRDLNYYISAFELRLL